MKHVRKTYEGAFHYGNKREFIEEETTLLEISNKMIVEDWEN